MNKAKKVIITVVSLVLVVCLTVGGILIYRWNSARKNPVEVIPVSSINNSWYGDSSYNDYIYGNVVKGMTQTVNYDSTLTVKEILVKEGDEVQVGTPLINYDTTLLNLQMSLKENEIKTIDLKIESIQKKLINLKKTRPVADSGVKPEEENIRLSGGSVKSYTGYSLSGSGLFSIVKTGGSTENSSQEDIPVLSEVTDESQAYKGDGTTDSPYCFRIKAGASISDGFITAAVTGKISCRFEVVADETSTDILYTWVLNGSAIMDIIKDNTRPDETEPDETVPDETEPDEPYPDEPYPDEPDPIDPVEPDPDGMTREELNAAIRDAENELEQLNLDKKAVQIDYQKLKNKLTDGTLLSTVNGVVGKITDQDTAGAENKPILTVTAKDGTYIEGYIGENSLDSISIGQKANIMDYMTGSDYEARVTYVSDISSEDYTQDSSQSYYKFTALVTDGEALNDGDGVDITLVTDNTQNNALYIEKAYVREDGGISYVYIEGENGRLRKQPVKTGKIMDNYIVEILEGLFESDYIAFPYGKNVKEGAPVKEDGGSSMY